MPLQTGKRISEEIGGRIDFRKMNGTNHIELLIVDYLMKKGSLRTITHVSK